MVSKIVYVHFWGFDPIRLMFSRWVETHQLNIFYQRPKIMFETSPSIMPPLTLKHVCETDPNQVAVCKGKG